MMMSKYNTVFICSTLYDGCGHVGPLEEWDSVGDADEGSDLLLCPICRDDHCFQLTTENFERLVDQYNRPLAKHLFYGVLEREI